MKVLLDHNVPQGLRSSFPEGVDIATAGYLGWENCSDEQPLTRAERNSFAVLITLDTSIADQQDLDARSIGVIIVDVHPATIDHLEAHVADIIEALPRIAERRNTVVIS